MILGSKSVMVIKFHKEEIRKEAKEVSDLRHQETMEATFKNLNSSLIFT